MQHFRSFTLALAVISLVLCFKATLSFTLSHSRSSADSSSLKSTFTSRLRQDTSGRAVGPFRRSPRLSPSTALSATTPLRVLITGAPASGKGTQCSNIVKNHGLVHLSTGDMLRVEIANESPLGLQAKDYMNRGILVPDEVVCGIVADKLSQPECVEKGILLDGFPRTEKQAGVLQGLLKEKNLSIDVVIFLNVDEEKLMERVIGRRVDPFTGDSYHTTFNMPEDLDPNIKARLVQRPDDTESRAQIRLEQYKKNADQIRKFYNDLAVEVDGNGHQKEVEQTITDILEKIKAAKQ